MTQAPARSGGAALPKPLINRFRPMQAALLVYASGEAGMILANSAEYYYRNQIGIDPFLDEGTVGGVFGIGVLVAGLFQFFGLIASVVFVSMWTFRAMKNLHLSKAKHIDMSPGWAVGWYFIPFANLWKPFQGMQEIWRGSRAQAGQSITVDASAGWWWATWIVSNILSNISVRLSGFMEEGVNYDAGLLVAVAASFVSILCTFFLLRTTRVITEAQQKAGRASVAETFA